MWAVVLSAVGTCALVSGLLPLGVKGKPSAPHDSTCVTYEKQSYDKTDAYGFKTLFLPRYSLVVCVCVRVCGVGGGWELVYSSHTLLRVLSTGEEKAELGRVKVQHTSVEFSGIKILPVSSLETGGTTASGALKHHYLWQSAHCSEVG